MTFRVTVLQRANRDAEQIVDWLSERSQDGAAAWKAAYVTAVHRLRANPLGYGLAVDCEHLDELIVRQFLFKTRRGKTYRGLFVVAGNEVRVLRVRGPGQPPLTVDELI